MRIPPYSRTIRAFRILIAVSAWFGIILQFPLSIAFSRAKGMSIALATLTYFSYFTILTNLLVAFGLSCTLWFSTSRLGRFFMRATVQSATAVYIGIVGTVYMLALRDLWNPAGLQKIADIVLHELVPILYVVYWLLFVSRTRLAWKSVVPWLLYPAAYLTFVLARGALSDWYPYPFIDAASLGYPRVAQNALLLFIVFLIVGLIAVAFSRWRGRNDSREREPIRMV